MGKPLEEISAKKLDLPGPFTTARYRQVDDWGHTLTSDLQNMATALDGTITILEDTNPRVYRLESEIHYLHMLIKTVLVGFVFTIQMVLGLLIITVVGVSIIPSAVGLVLVVLVFLGGYFSAQHINKKFIPTKLPKPVASSPKD